MKDIKSIIDSSVLNSINETLIKIHEINDFSVYKFNKNYQLRKYINSYFEQNNLEEHYKIKDFFFYAEDKILFNSDYTNTIKNVTLFNLVKHYVDNYCITTVPSYFVIKVNCLTRVHESKKSFNIILQIADPKDSKPTEIIQRWINSAENRKSIKLKEYEGRVVAIEHILSDCDDPQKVLEMTHKKLIKN